MIQPLKSKQLILRMDERTMKRLKALAERQHLQIPAYLRRQINLAFERNQPPEADDE